MNESEFKRDRQGDKLDTGIRNMKSTRKRSYSWGILPVEISLLSCANGFYVSSVIT